MTDETKELGMHQGIPTTWRLTRLPDVVFFQEGPGLRKWQWTDNGMKVINVTNILADGRIDTTNTSRFISLEEFHRKYSHFAVDDRDIVVASSGNTYGKVGRISRNDLPLMMNTSVIRFRSADRDRLNDDFLYAFLRSHLFRQQVESFVIGSAQPNFGPSHLQRMEMPLPPLSVQRRIADVLSAYDELIENSLRRIQILEEMAHTLYREWFVDFRYPGRDSIPLMPSDLGNIPRDWTIKSVAESFEVRGGGTPSRTEPRFWIDGDICWFAPRDLTAVGTMFIEESKEKISQAGLTGSSARLFPPYSVMLTSRATIGAIAVNTVPAATNQGFITCLPNEGVPLWFLYWWVRENVPTFDRLASGATFKEISRGVFKTIQFLHPPTELVRRFESVVEPWGSGVLNLQRKVRNLRQTRELLLPRLLSGQLNLAEVEANSAPLVESIAAHG